MRLILLAIAVGLAGCVTNAPNPWETIEVPNEPVEPPLIVPEAPQPIAVSDTTVTLDLEGAKRIREIVITCDANTRMAAEYADAIAQYRQANQSLIEAGRAQRVQTDLARDMLEDERRSRTVERIGYWAIIAGVAAVAIP